MQIIESNYKITQITPNALEDIEYATRDCYQSHDHIKESSAEIMVANLIERGHEAMLEFADMTVRFTCDRGISHELVRHRLCSFAQESTRYVDGAKKGIAFIKPSTLEVGYQTAVWEHAMLVAEENYLALRSKGCKPEIARSVLPNSLATHINMKANLREWRHIFKLRTSKFAHPDMRAIMIPLLAEAKLRVHVVFANITVD